MPLHRRRLQGMRAGLLLLALLVLSAVGADFFAPYAANTQARERYFSPPTPLHFIDGEGRWHWRPFVYGARRVEGEQVLYVEDRLQAYPLRFFVPSEPYRLFGLLPCRTHLFGTDSARIFILGSDALGRDVFSRLLYGARFSLTMAGVALLLALPLAILLGSLSGFYGGKFDFVSMRVVELFLALPSFYLVIALRSALPLDLAPEKIFAAMVTVIALFGWAAMARIVRGAVIALREEDFILAAIALGATDRRIIWNHILPNLTGLIMTQAALTAPGYILAEVTLSYLGLGVPEPLPSWGGMLASVGGVQQLGAFWWNLAPGAVIFATNLAFYLLAEGLRARGDPRLRGFGDANFTAA